MKKRDAEMSSTKKPGKWHFGMKGHIGVDSNSGIVHSLIDNLLRGQEKAILGDIVKRYRKTLSLEKSLEKGFIAAIF